MKDTVAASDPHRESVAELLIRLLASEDELGSFVDELAFMAAAEIGQDSPVSCGIMLVRNRRSTIVRGSDDAARRFEDIHTYLGAGPRVEAKKTGAIICVEDADEEKRWRDFMEIAVLHDLRSLVAVPLDIDDTAQAVMTFYTMQPHSFREPTLSAVQRFVEPVKRSLRVAVRTARFAEAAEHRQRAMESRTVIDVAIGITMAQAACSQDEAVAILKRASSHRNIKLRTLAGDLVDSLGQPEPITPFIE
ncbi:GAF and ANTAR domain-containing protein [Brevibacterium sediminis]|uniref:GAF and ANTAR domain-containing protein n=1 Tax=Brevibacterium sediminis TaxID=1857024 RepID=UPI003B3A29CC